jgi:hypothetical protein
VHDVPGAPGIFEGSQQEFRFTSVHDYLIKRAMQILGFPVLLFIGGVLAALLGGGLLFHVSILPEVNGKAAEG